MKKLTLLLFVAIIFSCSIVSCSYKLLPPTVIKTTGMKRGTISDYTHFYIPQTETLKSGRTDVDWYTGSTYGQQKSVNPGDVITGFLAKKGFIKVSSTDDMSKKTLTINYGESGRREVGLGGYTIEVTIQFIDSRTNTLVLTCVAEGIGPTEADDIRIAINRCLESIF